MGKYVFSVWMNYVYTSARVRFHTAIIAFCTELFGSWSLMLNLVEFSSEKTTLFRHLVGTFSLTSP